MPPVCHPVAENLVAYEDRWSAFAQLLNEIATRLAELDPATIWPIIGTSGSHIGDVTLADFAYKFANISWTLTDKDYSALNGGVGEVLSRFEGKAWLSAAEEIRASDFAVYMEWPNREGATYLALHETAHTTELGIQLNKMLYDQFIHMGGDRERYPNSAQWLYNEATANLIARTVAEAIGLPMLPSPTGGFPAAMIRKVEVA